MAEDTDDFSTVPSGIRKKILEEARKKEEAAKQAPVSPMVAPAAQPAAPKPQLAPPAPSIVPKEEKKVVEVKPPAAQQAPAQFQLPALPKIPELKAAQKKQEVVYVPQLPPGPPPQFIQEPARVEEVRQSRKEAPMAKRREDYEEERTPKKHLLSANSRGDGYDYGVYTQPTALRKGWGMGGLLLYVALIVALASLYFAYTASSEVAQMKGEMGGMANDLKIFRSKEISVMAPLSGNVVLKKELPLSGIFPPTLRATGTLILPIKTTLRAYSPTGGTIYEIPINQNVSIDFVAPLDFSKTGVGQSLIIDDQVPVGNYVNIKITARDVWGRDLDAIINRLEQASQ
ncbi:MAG: hypothetical protein Q7T16_01610 [Candidatus Burarchaeum sp.]|nr:hypothetical protein [Candidatus Burarchaeum sp.]MDO8339333.1 hypothetical protein [Candidatus Burarchaeum sp.]